MAIERYVPVRAGELGRSDRRVCLVGTVKEARPDGNFVLEDGGVGIEIVSDGRLECVKTGRNLRVFATNFEGKLKADVVQDIGDADLKIYEKVMEMYRKAGIS